jgi:hypothetical protein
MGSPFYGIDVIGEGEEAFSISIIVLKGDLHLDAALHPFDIDGFGMNAILVLIQVFDEGDDPSFVIKLVLLIGPLIFDADEKAFIQEGQLPQTLGKRIETELGGLKDPGIGFETDLGPGMFRLPGHFEFGRDITPFIHLMVDFAVSPDLQLHVFGKGIHHGETHAVKASRDLIALIIKFTSGVEFGHDHFHRRALLLLVHIDRDAAAIISNGDAVVDVNDDLDALAITGQGFIDAVIHQLLNHMVKAFDPRIPNIHGRPFPDG